MVLGREEPPAIWGDAGGESVAEAAGDAGGESVAEAAAMRAATLLSVGDRLVTG